MSIGKHETQSQVTEEPYIAYEGGYHERAGFATPGSPGSSPKTSWLYAPNSKWTWAFLGITVSQAVIALALEGSVFGEFQVNLENDAPHQPSSRTIPTYLSLFIFGFLYQVLLAYDGLRLRNLIQVFGLCVYNLGLFIDGAIQYDQVYDAVAALASDKKGIRHIDPGFWQKVKPQLVAIPTMLGLGTVLMSIVAWKLHGEFAWSIYKAISADLRLKRRYLSYQIYIALLKFDFFFFLAFTVQFLVVVVNTTDVEFYLTICAIPITIVLLFLAAYWTRKENIYGMGCIIVFYFAALAYFFFKLIRMYDGPYRRVEDYIPARRTLTTFAVLTILLLVITIVYAFICTSNFGKGLKPHIASDLMKRSASARIGKLDSHTEVPLAGPGQIRLTID